MTLLANYKALSADHNTTVLKVTRNYFCPCKTFQRSCPMRRGGHCCFFDKGPIACSQFLQRSATESLNGRVQTVQFLSSCPVMVLGEEMGPLLSSQNSKIGFEGTSKGTSGLAHPFLHYPRKCVSSLHLKCSSHRESTTSLGNLS